MMMKCYGPAHDAEAERPLAVWKIRLLGGPTAWDEYDCPQCFDQRLFRLGLNEELCISRLRLKEGEQ